MWALGTEPRSSARAGSALTTERLSSTTPPILLIVFKPAYQLSLKLLRNTLISKVRYPSYSG